MLMRKIIKLIFMKKEKILSLNSLKKKKMVIFLQRRTALAIANENFRESFKQRKDEFDHLSRLVEG